MAWDHLAIDKPHLVYIILGGFTSIFMLCSSVIKERLYIGEATVATLCGLIFGPHAANLIDPDSWGNTDQITVEFARIVLVVQCFAVGVELPRAYMEKHWKSVVLLLVPVMTFGWLITSLFIWAFFHPYLNWLDSLTCAACVTATDPVLASSVVGKGKFAKRVPKHLRDLLSAESGCNDGMAFPFIYLAIYLVRYRPDANEVALDWFCITILYECIFGAIYGFIIGYIARRAIRFAHERNYIDRESFLVFYFVLALFCAGSGSLLGMDDLLIGFSCGVGFSNDGWFTEKTEESHVSNVIDLLINLTFFVYFGTIIPWAQFNSAELHIEVWKLVVIAFLVLFFRRLPIMMALKPFIPDIKTWREALFAGHFGPIGVGAIFVAILARAELETDSTTPVTDPYDPPHPHQNIINTIWPITTFLVLTSILVHGSSIAVFTLGKHINTLTITMSYTQGNDEGNWMDRLPRIQSRSKSSMSIQKDDSDLSSDEKLPEYPAAAAVPRNFLRRQRTEDTPAPQHASSRRRKGRSLLGAGGHIDPSAIQPLPRPAASPDFEKSESDTLYPQSSDEQSPPHNKLDRHGSNEDDADEPEEEVFREGHDTVFEDEQGSVLEVMHGSKKESEKERDRFEQAEARRLMRDEHIEHGIAHHDHPDQGDHGDAADAAADESAEPGSKKGGGWKNMRHRLKQMNQQRKEANEQAQNVRMYGESKPRQAPARAFRFGRTIIVEDEDGEVIKKYDIPGPENQESARRQSYVDPEKTRQRLAKMGKALGVSTGAKNDVAGPSRPAVERRKSKRNVDEADEDGNDDDKRIRFTVNGQNRRMSKQEFIRSIEGMNPKTRMQVVEDSNAPEIVKELARADAHEHGLAEENMTADEKQARSGIIATAAPRVGDGPGADVHKIGSNEDKATGPEGLTLVSSRDEEIPFHSVSQDLREHARGSRSETAAQKRRRLAGQGAQGSMAPPVHEARGMTGAERRRGEASQQEPIQQEVAKGRRSQDETPAERKRREGALGVSHESDSDEDDDSGESHQARGHTAPGHVSGSSSRAQSIKFADSGETPAERRRRIAALSTSPDSDSEEDETPREPPANAVPGAASPTEETSSSRVGGGAIRFADAVRPGGKAFPSVRWKH